MWLANERLHLSSRRIMIMGNGKLRDRGSMKRMMYEVIAEVRKKMICVMIG